MKQRRRTAERPVDEGRRAALGALAAGGAAGAVALTVRSRAPAEDAVAARGPRELDLDDADLRPDPNLAG